MRNAVMPLFVGDSLTMQRETCFLLHSQERVSKPFISSPRLFIRKNYKPASILYTSRTAAHRISLRVDPCQRLRNQWNARCCDTHAPNL